MTDILIRRAATSDLQTLVDFQQKLAFETEGLKLDAGTLENGINALLADEKRGYYSIAEIAGEAAGCFMLTFEWSDWRNGWVYWLQSVYVKESFRQRGVFKAMFNHLLTAIQHNSNVIGFRLYVDKSNVRAQHVYNSLGMNGDHYSVYECMK